jgi:Protein of unknown function (DUF3253)
MTPPGLITDAALETGILAALSRRAADASACPSEIAREFAPHDELLWRSLMPRIREAAARLSSSERVLITRGAQVLAPDEFVGGPIRLRRGAKFLRRNP